MSICALPSQRPAAEYAKDIYHKGHEGTQRFLVLFSFMNLCVLCTTKCFEILLFLANFPGQRWSAILFPMTRFPDDPIFQIIRSPDHRITRSQALAVAPLRCVLGGYWPCCPHY